MRIIVLGSLGFIGQAVLKFYKERGYIVVGVDIVEKEAADYYCLKAEKNSFDAILNSCQPDVIINAAGAANVGLSIKDPEWDYASNTLLVFNLLNSLRLRPINCRFIQLSSAAVYGNPLQLPVTENEPVKPLSPYGFHKWQSEIICREFAELYGLKIAIARIFSAYGIGLRKQLFWDLHQKTGCTNLIELFGTGNESRDFIFIDDLVEAIDCIVQNGKLDATVYNVANGKEIFIKDAVACFLQNVNWKGSLSFTGGNRTGDPINWEADIEPLKSLGYKQSITFEKGIELYCKWLHEQE